MNFRTHYNEKWRRVVTAISIVYAILSIWTYSRTPFGKEVFVNMFGEEKIGESIDVLKASVIEIKNEKEYKKDRGDRKYTKDGYERVFR